MPYLNGRLDDATALREVALGLIEGNGPVRPSEFGARYVESVTALGGGGANPNAMFFAMMAVNQLHELGLRPESTAPDAPWSRPPLRHRTEQDPKATA